MKTSTFCFLFLLLISSLSTSQPQQFWGEQNSGVTAQLTSVSAIDFQVVWVCGYNGTVLRTTNSGLNWLNVSGGGIPNTVSLVNVWGISASAALVAGYQGTNTWVWKTTNSGSNWVQVFSQTGGFINGIIMKNAFPDQGIMQGDPVDGRWSLWKTTNAGTNWDSTGMYLPQAAAEAGWNNSICYSSFWFSADTSIWFGTNNYRVYHSSNGGLSWVAQSTSPEQNSYAIDYLGYFWGGGLTGGATLMRTTNFGFNWSQVPSLGSGNFGGFVVFPAPVDEFGYCWYVRSDNKIYRGGSGYNWQVEYTAPAGSYRHLSKARNGAYIWAVRSNGGITRCTCYLSGITKLSGSVPDVFSLRQNFPNPFNPQTSIDFDIPRKSKVKLNVYDLSGRLVTSLIDYELIPGQYRVSWDASGLASGVYFYSLITDEYVQTRKMILMK